VPWNQLTALRLRPFRDVRPLAERGRDRHIQRCGDLRELVPDLRPKRDTGGGPLGGGTPPAFAGNEDFRSVCGRGKGLDRITVSSIVAVNSSSGRKAATSIAKRKPFCLRRLPSFVPEW
jgi:hypothetical protein